MNNVILQGRIPFAPNFIPANGEKKACIFFVLAVQTKQKDEETGYYKELNIKCRAFAGWAESIYNEFQEKGNRTIIDVEGELVQGQDYTNQEGELVKGQLELNILRVHNYNTLDKTLIKGRIPNFENAIKYVEATENKKAAAFFTISVSTGIKDEETGYYKERLVKCKAFNGIATFFNNHYKKGDTIVVEGKYVDGQDYTNQEGELVKGSPELLIGSIYGYPQRKENKTEKTTSNKTAPSPLKKGLSKEDDTQKVKSFAFNKIPPTSPKKLNKLGKLQK